MLYFSYNDYADLTENGKIDGILKVEEKGEKYKVNSRKKDNIITLLQDNQEMINFIREFLHVNYIQSVSICNNIKIDNNKNNQKQILYKVDSKNIYLFIKKIDEFQSKKISGC